MRTQSKAAGAGAQAGFSLIEGLIAAALLLVVAVSVLPLFVRALESNLAGGRRSQLSTFAGAELEEVNQAPVDQAAWSVTGQPGGVLTLDSRFWDAGAPSVPDTLGDERWVDAEGDAVGLIQWQSDVTIRKYALADLQILIGSGPGGGVVSGGLNPMLFDDPLSDDEGAHFIERRVTVKERRAALPAATGKRITVSQLRAF